MLARRKSSVRRFLLTTSLIIISLILGSLFFSLFLPIQDESFIDKFSPKFDNTLYCERSLTFVLSDCCGLPFQMTGLINAMIYAEDTGRSFFLNDSHWNYGRWENFFEPLRKPHCVLPENNPDLFVKFPDRELSSAELKEMNMKFKRGSHQLMTRHSWHLLDEYISNTYYQNPSPNKNFTINEESGERERDAELESIFGVQELTLKKIWRLNREMKKLIHDQSHEIGVPHNHGGIPSENSYLAFQIHRSNTLDLYISAAERYLIASQEKKNQTDFNNNEEVVVFLSSRSDLIEISKKLSNKKPNWQLLTSFDDEPMYRFSSALKSRHLMEYKLESRINFGMAFIADLTLMRHAEHLICTFAAPSCRFLVLLKGWRQWRSTTIIDDNLGKDWFPTLFPIGENGEPMNLYQIYLKNQKVTPHSRHNHGKINKFDVMGTK
ncbi:hypothetical protein G9A89_015026 [Geosiphon pyriformis]|nr:hypothetical protein G9A89_015026 [Geosiphon pyriformis]